MLGRALVWDPPTYVAGPLLLGAISSVSLLTDGTVGPSTLVFAGAASAGYHLGHRRRRRA
jgi:hypothetical protein